MSLAAVQPLAEPDQPMERRERRHVNLRGHAILPDRSVSPIIVLDLSYEGCGIQIPDPLKPGDVIRLSVLRRGVIEAHVRWYRDGKAGLIFEPEKAADEPAHRERQSKRVALLADVAMRRLGKVNYSVRAYDASAHGCRVEFVDRPQVGELVRVKLGELQAIDARICWVEARCAGLEFERPIHPAVFDLLVERMMIVSEKG